MRPSVVLADRDRDRAAGVDDLVAALEAVGRVHRDRADAVVAEVLLDLAGQRALACASPSGSTSIVERRVDLGQLVGEDDVDDDAGHLLDRPDVSFPSFPFCQPFVSFVLFQVLITRAPSAPATTSRISWVISAWRTRFISRVRSLDHVLGVLGRVPHRGHPRRRARRRSTRAAPGRR